MEIRQSLLPLPRELVGRPIDHRGFPVPWFVTNKTKDDQWDFVHVSQTRINEAIRNSKCFVSGEKMGKFAAFVVGPMCTINRIASDPPCKPSVGDWSAMHCPFLSNPSAKRPGGEDAFKGSSVGGVPIAANPGVTAVWVTRHWGMSMQERLFQFGEPERVTWYHKGRLATVAEAREGFEAGAQRLMDMAEKEGSDAVEVCRRSRVWNMKEKMPKLMKHHE